MQTMEQLKTEYAAKARRLERDLRVAEMAGPFTVQWEGHGPFDKACRMGPLGPQQAHIAPYLVHSPFRGAEHVAYRIDDIEASHEHKVAAHTAAIRAFAEFVRARQVRCAAAEGVYKTMGWKGCPFPVNDYASGEVAEGDLILSWSSIVGFDLAGYIREGDTVSKLSIGLSDMYSRGFDKFKARPEYRAYSENWGGPRKIERWHRPRFAGKAYMFTGVDRQSADTQSLLAFADLEAALSE